LLRIHILNVDHGDSIILEYESLAGKVFGLIDSNVPNNVTSPPALTKLQALGATRLSFVALTHPHFDHYHGLLDVLEYYDGKVDNFISYPLGKDFAERRKKLQATYKKVVKNTDSDYLKNASIEFFKLLKHVKESIKIANWEEYNGPENSLLAKGFNGVEMKVILPHPKAKGDYFELLDSEDEDVVNSPDLNKLSLAFNIRYAGIDIVLGGDGTGSSWNFHKNVFARAEQTLNGDFVKLPHHGSKKDCNEKVLRYLFRDKKEGKIAFISANGRSHPDEEVILNIEKHGILPYCTNLTDICRANIKKINFSDKLNPELNSVINWFENYNGEAVQPCQGNIELTITDDGAFNIKTEFDHPCIFRGDYDFLSV
jgi:beta-lactamase superfamily II metal-dependent hydrolase